MNWATAAMGLAEAELRAAQAGHNGNEEAQARFRATEGARGEDARTGSEGISVPAHRERVGSDPN
jgi:hypothetical protein